MSDEIGLMPCWSCGPDYVCDVCKQREVADA